VNTAGWPGGFVALSAGVAAWALAEAGAATEADLVIQRLRGGPDERRWNAALPLLRLGRVNETVGLLEQSNQLSLFFPVFLSAGDAKLREDARVRAALEKVHALEALDAQTAVLVATDGVLGGATKR
jgi:hypothetical protein